MRRVIIRILIRYACILFWILFITSILYLQARYLTHVGIEGRKKYISDSSPDFVLIKELASPVFWSFDNDSLWRSPSFLLF